MRCGAELNCGWGWSRRRTSNKEGGKKSVEKPEIDVGSVDKDCRQFIIVCRQMRLPSRSSSWGEPRRDETFILVVCRLVKFIFISQQTIPSLFFFHFTQLAAFRVAGWYTAWSLDHYLVLPPPNVHRRVWSLLPPPPPRSIGLIWTSAVLTPKTRSFTMSSKSNDRQGLSAKILTKSHKYIASLRPLNSIYIPTAGIREVRWTKGDGEEKKLRKLHWFKAMGERKVKSFLFLSD